MSENMKETELVTDQILKVMSENMKETELVMDQILKVMSENMKETELVMDQILKSEMLPLQVFRGDLENLNCTYSWYGK